jgi:hypothetical protein
MQVVNLAEYEHLIPELAQLHFLEWSCLRPGESLEGRTARLRKSCGTGIPSVVVGLLHGELCGSAMLVAYDLDERPNLTPWLAAFMSNLSIVVGGLVVSLSLASSKTLGLYDAPHGLA